MKKPKKCPFCGKNPKVSKVTDLGLPSGFEKFVIVCEHYRCNVNPKVTHYGSGGLVSCLAFGNRRDGK